MNLYKILLKNKKYYYYNDIKKRNILEVFRIFYICNIKIYKFKKK